MTNKAIANKFKLLSDLMELHGGNPFRIKSYQSAYRTIRGVEGDIFEKSVEELSSIRGVGDSTIDKIFQIKESGSFSALDDFISKTPEGILEMLSIKGFGAKKIKTIWKDLEVDNVGELLYACEENRLVDLKGFGAKTQATLIEQLKYHLQSKGKALYANIIEPVNALLDQIKSEYKVTIIDVAGQMRRLSPIIDKIDIIYVEAQASNHLVNNLIDNELVQSNDANMTFHSVPIEFHPATEEDFVKDRYNLTSALSFLPKMETSESTEKAFFEKNQCCLILPEMQESNYEKVYFEEFKNEGLISRSSLKGVIHNHSTYSDGTHSLKDMVQGAIDRGYEYLVITDHSKAAFYANGLSEERLANQINEIQLINKSQNEIHVFSGIEADILNDGRLDYTSEILETLDVVIASVHSNLKMDEAKATARIVKAVENPLTTILGHPTGRLLLSRKGYPIDHGYIIDACAANNVAIEINANPNRLDLDWEWVIYALEKGVYISINPDAHSIRGYDDVQWGINVARKAGLLVHQCLNAMNKVEFSGWLGNRSLHL